jgi:hypothetical protein
MPIYGIFALNIFLWYNLKTPRLDIKVFGCFYENISPFQYLISIIKEAIPARCPIKLFI